MRRRTILSALALVIIAPALACGFSETLTETAFVTACTSECSAQGPEQGLCETYCNCSYRYARDNDRLEELNNVQVVEGQPLPPVIVDLMEQCGSDVWDSNFRRGCLQNCTHGAVCQERCDCFLRELRGSDPRGESTRFLIENLDVNPPTPAGEQRLEAAENVCPP